MKDKIKQELDQVDCNKIASYGGYSVKQMNRIFTSQTNMNLGEYIRYRKMAQALWDLRYTNADIIQIAVDNGFDTQESFTRAFKSIFHITPRKFRETREMNHNAFRKSLEEVIEEVSHYNARSRRQELPNPTVSIIRKPKKLWYSLKRNEKDLFPHDFYTSCQKEGLFQVINHAQNMEVSDLEGVYLTHIYQGQKFTSLTIGFEYEYKNEIPTIEDFDAYVCPESEYLKVNVPPYANYELGGHVLAAWEVFSDFDYEKHNLRRDLEHAPIFEFDSKEDGYTLYFPVIRI